MTGIKIERFLRSKARHFISLRYPADRGWHYSAEYQSLALLSIHRKASLLNTLEAYRFEGMENGHE